MKKKIIILSLAILILGCYLYFENTSLITSNYTITSDLLPSEFDNYKIIQISDYHNEKSNRLNEKLLNKIKSENPDIITITGDFIDSRNTNIDVAVDFIKKIKDIAPIYYVMGNHESRISSYKELKEKLEIEGVTVLENETSFLEKEDSKINIIGVNDPDIVHDSMVGDVEIIKDELTTSNYDQHLFSILLCHRPELFNTYVEKNIDLVLSGHAHGGQIRIPFIGGIVAPNQGMFPKYTNGLYNEKNTNMIVSRGIGNSLFPFRVNNQPELVIIHLKIK